MASNQAAAQAQPPAVVLTPASAIEQIKGQFPDAAQVLEAVLKKDIVALATDEAFALRDKDGEIRAYKQAVTFSRQAGTLIQPVQGGPFVVSAQGYEYWAESAGAAVIFPSEVLVDGQWQPNPAVIRDSRTGRLLMIYARAVAFRFSPMGIPMVTDWTTIYDTPSYRMVDLLAKAKKTPQAFKLLPLDMKPDEDGTWAKYPFDEATVLWMNTSHNEALDWLSQIINREKKAIDFAQTFARRNALKHLSGLQKAPGEKWTTTVFAWRPTNGNIVKWDASQYAALQGRVGKLISGDRSEFKDLDLQTGSEATSTDMDLTGMIEEEEIIDGDAAPADAPAPITEEPTPPTTQAEGVKPVTAAEPPKPALSDEQLRILSNLDATKQMLTEEYLQACKNLKINPAGAMSVENAVKIMAEINRIVDTANNR